MKVCLKPLLEEFHYYWSLDDALLTREEKDRQAELRRFLASLSEEAGSYWKVREGADKLRMKRIGNYARPPK
jgi:hypothetical protein